MSDLISTIHINLGDRDYDIFVGEGLYSNIAAYIPVDIAGRKVFIITDENVEPYAKALEDQIKAIGAGFCARFVLPFGEKTKSFENFIAVQEWMLEHSVHRNSLVLAVGGGVIGDLAGFVASTVLRGVPFVQIPTSLLSQVDSSVGGKTGINTRYGKNLVGAFYQPLSVAIDIESLKTLPKRELLAGYAEVVKYGLIGDAAFFDWLDVHGEDVIALEREAVSKAIEVSCRAKAKVVEEDERESGARALLNLGHTFGHALEAAAGYDGTLLHGEGVAIGTVMAYELSVLMGYSSHEDVERVRAHFITIGLPVDLGSLRVEADDLLATMKRDKKAQDDNMVFIVPRGIGDTFVCRDVTEDQVRQVLDKFI